MGIFWGDHMARHKKEDLIVGLDIGTTKICAIVAEANENGVDIVGIGTHHRVDRCHGARTIAAWPVGPI